MLKPVARFRRRTLAGVLAALLAAPAVAVGTASAAQADAVRQQELWVLNAINVAGAWRHTHGSGVTVALIDSGVNGQVSDLAGSVKTGRDFSGVNTPETNANWGIHGTWMASLIVGHGHAAGSSGIMGVAPAAKVLSIRAVTDQGDPGYRKYQHESESRVQDHLAAAIRYATSKNVSVISMSLGYQGPSRSVRKAISAALTRGIVVVASSGNSGGSSSAQHGNAPYSFPADYPGVLGVGAVAQTGLPAGFSSDNLSVQVAAPGVRVPAQGRDGQYWLVSGTSPACALTAGVAALIKSVYPTLGPSLVVQAITASTWNKPHGGYDEQVGFGTVDAAAALRMAGRLARDRGTGHGLVATAQFGGGTAAIPAVPVTPRGKSQLVTDLVAALLCLAIVLVIAFRLIAARRAAVAAAPAGPGPPGAGASGAAWTGLGPAGYGTSADHRPAVGYPEQTGYSTPDAYGTQDAYGTPAGYRPPAAERPGGNYPPRPPVGSPGSYGPRDNKSPDGQTAPGSYGSLAEYGPPEGHAPPGTYGLLDGQAAPGRGSLDGPGSPVAEGPLADGGWPDSSQAPDRRDLGSGPSAGYDSPAGYGPAARFGPQAGDQPPTGYRRPGVTQAPGSFPDRASTGPLSPYQPQEPPAPPAGLAEDPLAADGDTWPPSGQW
jgi:hypothetical protein